MKTAANKKRRRSQGAPGRPCPPAAQVTRSGLAGQRAQFLILGLIGILCATLALSAVARKSVTVDEFAHLPHGLAVLKTGAFHIDIGESPLSQIIAAVPLLFSSARFDIPHPEEVTSCWRYGYQFVASNPGNFQSYFMAGRTVSTLFLLLACLLTYGLARSLYGPPAGLVAAALTALSPTMIAHGSLITPDIYLTAALIGAFWALDRFLRRPDWQTGLLLGVAIGLATLFKFTGLLLFITSPLVLLAVLALQRFPPAATGWGVTRPVRAWLWMLLALAAAVLTINAGYLFDGSLNLLGSYHFATAPFQALQAILPGWLPVPLPHYFFNGLDAQLADTDYVAYLAGKFNTHGFHEYYLVGLLVKTPVPVLLLAIGAAAARWRLSRRELALYLTPALLFLFFSFANHKNIGLRYVLFVYPMLGIWISRLCAPLPVVSPRLWRAIRIALAGGALASLVSCLCIWPDYLTYFNWPSGGPRQGHRYLLDSNLDWGQDLITLRRYMERHGLPQVDLAYFGRIDPALYGVHYRTLLTSFPQRYAAISANFLWGRMYYINGTNDGPRDKETYARFRELEPEAILGNTIYLFDMNRQKRP